jgi:hypothetical protein
MELRLVLTVDFDEALAFHRDGLACRSSRPES